MEKLTIREEVAVSVAIKNQIDELTKLFGASPTMSGWLTDQIAALKSAHAKLGL